MGGWLNGLKKFQGAQPRENFLALVGGLGGCPRKFKKWNASDWLKMHFWQLRGVKFQVKFLLFVSVIDQKPIPTDNLTKYKTKNKPIINIVET